jgi:hypothetical protein
MTATSELRDELEAGLPGAVRALARRPSPDRSSFALEELDVTLADGSTLELVFKDVGRDALSEAGRRAKPRFLHGPAREIELYRRVLPRAPAGPPRCVAAAVDPARRRCWLFLERVAGAPLWEVGDLAAWRRTAGWLGRLHRTFRDCADPPLAGGRLLRLDTGFHRRWLDRARRFHRSGAAAAFLDRLAPHYEPVLERIDALPPTLVHGDAYPSNVIVTERRVCLLDWELAGIGPGLWDLAALSSGAWTEDERAALASAYREAEPGGGAGSELDLEACRLALAVQWLGWGDDWSPPREHRHDWLAEAVRSAERLGL